MEKRTTPMDFDLVTRELAASGLKNIGQASIREVKKLIDNIEKATGERFVRMEMGIPGLPPMAVGVEAMAAAQGMEFDRSLKSSPLIEAQFAAIRQRVAFLEQDRYLAPDIDAMREWALQSDWPAPLRACQPSHA